MRFWDSSAITPILVREASSELMAGVLASDGDVTAWWGTRVECTSALRRRERHRTMSPAAARRGLTRLAALADAWNEVTPAPGVRVEAERALAVHPLRAADALQLAAALVWRDGGEGSHELVCLDQRLRDAASREGFALVPDDEVYAEVAPR